MWEKLSFFEFSLGILRTHSIGNYQDVEMVIRGLLAAMNNKWLG